MRAAVSRPLRTAMLAVTLACAGLGTSAAAQDGGTIRIGVVAIRGVEHARRAFTPTAEYLNERIPGRRFEVVPVADLSQAGPIVGADGVEFMIAPPGEYVYLEHRFGLTRISTQRTASPSGPQTRLGGVIFVRAGSPIRTLEDTRGHSAMAVDERSFAGWMIQAVSLQEHGVDPTGDLQLEFFGFPQDGVVEAVRDGRADVGMVRSNILEGMAAAGTIRMEDFRVLDAQEVEGYPFVTSTPLYPEWAFAVARHTDQDLAQDVAIALLGMPADHPAARAASGEGWTVPLDYGPVHDVLRRLRRAPYDEVPAISVAEVIRQYWHVVLLAALALVGMALVTAYVARLNRRLGEANAALGREMEQRKQMEHQLLVSEKMASLGQMAAGIAHEINSPLGYVYSNIMVLQRAVPGLMQLIATYRKEEGLLPEAARARLQELRESTQIEFVEDDLPQMMEENIAGLRRMRQIVQDMRTLSHVGDQDWQTVDLRETLRSTLNIARKSIEEKESELVLDLRELPPVECVSSQVAQVFLNLVSNAIDANPIGGKISVRTRSIDVDHVAIEVSDTGPGIPDDVLRRIFDPFFTTKPVGSGTGLGLAIAMRIVKAHGGRIDVETELRRGTTFRVVLPIRATDSGERSVDPAPADRIPEPRSRAVIDAAP